MLVTRCFFLWLIVCLQALLNMNSGIRSWHIRGLAVANTDAFCVVGLAGTCGDPFELWDQSKVVPAPSASKKPTSREEMDGWFCKGMDALHTHASRGSMHGEAGTRETGHRSTGDRQHHGAPAPFAPAPLAAGDIEVLGQITMQAKHDQTYLYIENTSADNSQTQKPYTNRGWLV